MLKICIKCGIRKNTDEFSSHKHTVDGKISTCKECMKLYNKEYRKTDQYKQSTKEYKTSKAGKLGASRYRLKRYYKISHELYTEMLAKQEGKCLICKSKDLNRLKKQGIVINLCVDHDSKSGKIRGLLCYKCNIGMGFFDHDIELLLATIKYLKKYA